MYVLLLTQPDSPKGAILFAVVNAKLSEGINFQDDLARCVVMIGLPFPNAKSPELVERMEYMRKLDTHAKPDLGRELYLNLCMRAVNQSMGRAIRHRADYVRTDADAVHVPPAGPPLCAQRDCVAHAQVDCRPNELSRALRKQHQCSRRLLPLQANLIVQCKR